MQFEDWSEEELLEATDSSDDYYIEAWVAFSYPMFDKSTLKTDDKSAIKDASVEYYTSKNTVLS